MAASHRLIAFLPLLALAQNAPNTAIRVDVNLVQVDAVVTDAHGRRVSDLQASDFELFQDGRKQAITNFSYVAYKPEPHAAPHAPAKRAKGEMPPPPTMLHPSEVRRALAIVVDEPGLSAESIPKVRGAIRNFIDEQMRPGDLVAVVRAGAGMGALQQFTTDKRLLDAALAQVHYGESRVGVTSIAPLGSGAGGRAGRAGADLTHLREQSMAVGSLDAIRMVVDAMAGLPGRKSVILFTENIRLIFRGSTDQMVSDAVRDLSDAASRSSVVIDAIDPRGMQDFDLGASDNTAGMSSRRISRVPAQRQTETIRTQDGMFVLAEQTGGLFLHDSNDLAGALRQAAEDGDGYYLLGYHPEAGTFDNDKFHRVEVKVQKPGVHVRSRTGFAGRGETLEHTRDAELNRVFATPYSGSIHPRVTAFFSNIAQGGSFLTAFVFIDPRELQWSNEPDGSRKAQVDLAAGAVDQDGVGVLGVNSTFPLQFSATQYDEAVKRGIVYGLHIPIPRAGPYLVRAALRDPATKRAGSAQQFVEAPDISSGHLALSSLVLQNSVVPNDSSPQAAVPRLDFTAGAARRVFQRGTAVSYAFEVFNAVGDATRQPELAAQTRLFHDGDLILSESQAIHVAAGSSDPQRLQAAGQLTLGSQLSPGEYVLQVIVTDKLAKSKFGVVAQYADFEVR